MPNATVTVKLTREQLKDLLRSLPGVLSGRLPDSYGIGRACLASLPGAILKNIREDYILKSLGGTGEAGERWPELKPATIRQRQMRLGVGVLPGLPDFKVSFQEQFGALQQQRKREKDRVYRYQKERLMKGGFTEEQARKEAKFRASQAPKISRSIFESPVYDFKILIDTARLLESVSPGTTSGDGLSTQYHPPPFDQKVEIEPGSCSITSEVEYGMKHQTGGASSWGKTLPKRRFIPAPEEIPQRWLDEWAQVYANKLSEVLAEILPRSSHGQGKA